MHSARTYLGENGLSESFQNKFSAVVTCVNCQWKTARIAFVMCEEGGLGQRSEEARKRSPMLVCDLHENGGKGDEDNPPNLWAHDCCAVAVYLCSRCLKPTAVFNQA